MQPSPGHLYAQALRLPAAARAALAGQLINSLDAVVDDDAEQAWAAEIKRRVADIDAGRVRLVSWSAARRRILRKVGASSKR